MPAASRTLAVAVLLAGFAHPLRAQPQHDHEAMTACEACPDARESSGTSWQPELVGAMGHYRQLGPWIVSTHAQVTAAWIDERGPRGDTALVAPNHGMASFRRSAAGGVFGVRTMFSLDPLMGARGYPLLGQSGETADGLTPLADRQHPHDFVMELAATYERELASGARASLYVAAVGEPALGPPAFMHRPSGRLLPIAPITHHWFDSSHITSGVVTAGLAPTDTFRFEGSVFTGREPDHHRWGIERPRFDSYSLRLSINPTASLAIQGSVGVLNEPELFHGGADVSRVTASMMYAARSERLSFDGFAAVAQNTRHVATQPVDGGLLYLPGARSPAAIAEGTFGLDGRHHLVIRAETAQKGELFGSSDPRHEDQFSVTRATIGYVLNVINLPVLQARVGAAWSGIRVDEAIKADYGGNQTGLLIFVGVEVH